MRCSFLIIKPQTALHHVVQCTFACSVMWLCYFASNFGVIFVISVVWCTSLISRVLFSCMLGAVHCYL